MLSNVELKNFRERRNLSLRDVAEYAGISAEAISNVERGETKLNEDNHRKIVSGINRAFFAKVNNKKDDTKIKKEDTVTNNENVVANMKSDNASDKKVVEKKARGGN